MVTILARESISSIWDEAIPLAVENHKEAGALFEDDFNPKLGPYKALEDLGMLKAFSARDGAILVGYAVILVSPSHLHYPKTCWGMQDVMYLKPDHRGIVAAKFIIHQDVALRSDGIDLVYRHTTLHKDYSRLLVRLGYRAEEVRYFKDLREVA